MKKPQPRIPIRLGFLRHFDMITILLVDSSVKSFKGASITFVPHLTTTSSLSHQLVVSMDLHIVLLRQIRPPVDNINFWKGLEPFGNFRLMYSGITQTRV